jgi:predicted dehydrogenase
MAKTLRACVIGSTGRGNYGHGIDMVWREVPGVEIVGVADDDKSGLAAAVKRLGVERGFADYREMLDKLKPDIVGIGPRWLDRHAEMVIAAAERGVHVYMEKPFCRSPAEADSMVRACESAHVKLAVAHQTRYSPLVEVVRRLIAEGKIGRVLELRGRGKEDRRGGHEDLWVLGSHIMNLTATLGGAPLSCFGVVEQNGKPVTRADVVEANEGIGPMAGDSVRATYALEGGATAYFASTRGMAGKTSRFALQILGSAGIFEITSGYHPIVSYLDDPSWSPARGGSAWQKVSSAGIGKPEVLTDAGLPAGNVAVVKDLLQAIHDDRRPLCGMYEGRTIIEMISAVFESHRVGGPVPFPLTTRVNPLTLLK